MAMTMDDDGAILVHLTNPGGIVGGTGVANQITYWTDTDTIGGDAGLTYDAATDTITVAGNILMADDKFIGITGDIRIEFDSSDGDIMFHLGDAAGADEIQIKDSGGAIVAYIDSDGNADFDGHIAVGSNAVISATKVFRVAELTTALAGTIVGADLFIEFEPGAGYATYVYGFTGQVRLDTAQAPTGANYLSGVIGVANIFNTVAGTAELRGGTFYVDAEDGTSPNAYGLHVTTPAVDTGSCGNGFGVRIRYGGINTGGGGSMTTLYALYLDNFAAAGAGTVYAIYSAGGNSRHAGKVSIGGTVAPLAQLHVDQSSGSGAIPVLYLDQGDVSEPFTNYIGSSAASAANSLSSWTTGNAVQGHIQIDVNGVKRWLRFYNDPTS